MNRTPPPPRLAPDRRRPVAARPNWSTGCRSASPTRTRTSTGPRTWIRFRISCSRPARPTAVWRSGGRHTGTIVGGAERLDGALILPYPNRSSDTAEVNRFRRGGHPRPRRHPRRAAGHAGVRSGRRRRAGGACDRRLQGLLVLRHRPRRPAAGGAVAVPARVGVAAGARARLVHHPAPDARRGAGRSGQPAGGARALRALSQRAPGPRARGTRLLRAPTPSPASPPWPAWRTSGSIPRPSASRRRWWRSCASSVPRRLLFGTDYPISHQRGRAISLGTDFAWVVTDRGEQWDFPDETACAGRHRGDPRPAHRRRSDEPGRAGTSPTSSTTTPCACLASRKTIPSWGNGCSPARRSSFPAGTQLQSKNPDNLAPGAWPPYFREARGIDVWDESGRRFRDVGHHGIGAAALGYRDPDVTRAVMRRVALGSYSMLNSPRGDGGRRAAVRAPSVGGEGPLRAVGRRESARSGRASRGPPRAGRCWRSAATTAGTTGT